jgi:WD40 repeat protein
MSVSFESAEIDEIFLPNLPSSPYPGLRPFEKADWPIFFGRERMTDDVIEQLLQRRLVVIHGASGDGKSSLVRAGVQARLGQKYARSELLWHTCAMRPGNGPLANLAESLASLNAQPSGPSRIELRRALNQGRHAAKTVAQLLALRTADRVCILIDQFEELFRFAAEVNRDESSLLTDFLVGFHESPPDGLYVLVTMRSEFLAECAQFEGLAETINRTQYLLPRMSTDDLLRAVREPAALYGGSVTYRLAERLIADARNGQDGLPLIQHGLSRLWQFASTEENETGPVLDLPFYAAQGPLGRLLSDHADTEAEAVVGDTAQTIVEELFRALTDINAHGNAIRRPQTFADLVAVAGTTEESLRKVLDRFRASGTSFVTPFSPAPIQAETTIDISHEALIRRWQRIADPRHGWLQREFRDGLIWRSLLVQTESFVSDPESLLSEATTEARSTWLLGRNEAWARRYGGQWSGVCTLLDASRQEVERRRRRQRLEEEKELATKQRDLELVQVHALAEERQIRVEIQRKAAQRRLFGLIAVSVFAIVAIGAALFGFSRSNRASEEAGNARLREALGRVNLFAAQIERLRAKANTRAAYYFELKRDAARGRAASTTVEPQSLVTEIDNRANLALEQWRDSRRSIRILSEDLRLAILDSNRENERLWKEETSELERQRIVKNVESVLVDPKMLDPQSRLRVALLAVAAIPQSETTLNKALRNAIVEFKQQNHFEPPGASQIWALAVNPKDQHQAAIGDDNGVVWLWDPLAGVSGATYQHLSTTNGAKYGLAFGADGSLGTAALTVSGGVVNGLAFSADGRLLAAAYRNSGVTVWESGSDSPRCSLRPVGGNSGAYGVAFSGSLLAVAGGDYAVHLLDVAKPGCEEVQKIPRSDLVFGVAFSPVDRNLLAAASGDGTVAVWNIDKPDEPVRNFKFEKPMFAVAFSPDGKMLAATGADQTAYIWDVETWQRTTVPSQGGTVGQISFSPDQKFMVASAGDDGDAIVVDPGAPQKQGMRLDNGGKDLFGVAFTTGDSTHLHLLTGNLDGITGAWMITGKDDVVTVDRSVLMMLGSQRISSMNPDQKECQTLREMQIPILDIMERNPRGLQTNECPFSFLGP